MSAKRLTHEERAEIYRLWKEEGLTYRTIAERCGVNPATVGNVVKKMNGTPRKSQINEEFDAAVNQMIAEAKEPEPVTQKNMLHSTEIPDDVLTAVRDAIDYEDETVEDHLRTIRELQHEVEQRRTKAAIMRKWLEDCGYESTAD